MYCTYVYEYRHLGQRSHCRTAPSRRWRHARRGRWGRPAGSEPNHDARHGIAYAVARGNIEHSPARPCTHITRAGHPPHLVNALLPGFFQAPVPISHERKEALNDPKQRCPQCTSSCPAPTAPRSTSSSSRPSSSAPSPWLLCPARRRSPSLRWRAWRGGSLQDSPMWQRACSRRVARAWPRHGRHGAPSRSSRPVSAADRPRA